MDNNGPRITYVEQPQSIEDELEEELFFIRLNMDCLKKEDRAKPYFQFQEMELRKKEIEMRLKLIKLEKDF